MGIIEMIDSIDRNVECHFRNTDGQFETSIQHENVFIVHQHSIFPRTILVAFQTDCLLLYVERQQQIIILLVITDTTIQFNLKASMEKRFQNVVTFINKKKLKKPIHRLLKIILEQIWNTSIDKYHCSNM